MRCTHEATLHERNCFLTLTYDDDHLPDGQTLVLKDWQLFAKRLRKKIGKFRFMHCGEYGEEKNRPHYHALLFGQDFSEDRVFWKTTKNGHRTYISETLTNTWGKGHCLIGDLSFESAAYVARYNMKKINGASAGPHYNGRKPEYMTMSRRPGLGQGWIEKWKHDVFPSDEVIVNGRRTRPPKYYDAYIEKENQREMKKIKGRRKSLASHHEQDNTPERLATKQIVEKAKNKQKKRTL